MEEWRSLHKESGKLLGSSPIRRERGKRMDAVSKIRKIQEMQEVLGDKSPELTAELKAILRETVMEELRDPNYPVGEPVVETAVVTVYWKAGELPPQQIDSPHNQPR